MIAISCSFIILRYKKLFLLLQEPLKTRVNLKYQSKGSIYTLHLLSFVQIRPFYLFFWERKTGFGKVMKKLCGRWDCREKGAGMRDQDPHFQILHNHTAEKFVAYINNIYRTYQFE